jgi:nanoRNase/pAp phosphatase (c-di-AMP/oligoRNAs hydrolase)
MDAKFKKFSKKVGNAAVAAKLIEAGIDNPAKLRATSDRELVKLIGKAAYKKLRR